MTGLLTAVLCLALQAHDRYVDGSAPPGGDGSRARPVRTLAEALAPNTRLHLAPGHYEVELTLPSGSALLGGPGVVLEPKGGGLQLAPAEESLESLEIHGGAVGLSGRGARLRLRQVTFTDQKEAALRLDGGSLAARQLAITTPGWALDLKNVEVELEDTRVRAAQGCRLHEGKAKITRSTFEGEKGPALAISKAAVTLVQVVARNGVDGVIANDGAHLVLDRVQTEGRDTGLALVRADASLSAVTARAKAGDGARWIESTVRGSFEVAQARGTGVLVNGGKVSLASLRVSNVSGPADDDGSGLMVRRAEVSVERLNASELSGTAAWVAELGHLQFGQLVVTGAKQPALIVETHGTAKGRSVEVSGSAESAVLVSGPARLELDSLSTKLPPLATSCDANTEVHIGRGLPEPVTSYCVHE